jgi:zinc/manganese transport system substrate-binding protein
MVPNARLGQWTQSRVVRLALAWLLVLVSGAPAAVPRGPSAAAAPARLKVVAAENFYGDIVGQLAGDHVSITNILSDPTVDPHEYETNAWDAAAVANARLVIQNGLGYDTFIDHLVAASPNPQRKLIVVADLTGHHSGDNPHLWYDPATIPEVARAVVQYLTQVDPEGASSYWDRYRAFQVTLRPLAEKVAALRARYAGAPVAVTEPVFNYMAQAIGLDVLTPEAFQKAIEDGEDPPAAAVARMQDQLRSHRVRVLLYNTQAVSPITTRVQQLATQAGVPVVGVSETEPPGKSYQQWMLGQLDALAAALGQRR